MKILIATGIYPPEIGGPASFVPVVSEFLLRQGHQVRVITYGDEKTRRDAWIVSVVGRSGGVIGRYVRYAHAVWHAVRQDKPDWIFLQGPVSEGVPAMIVARWFKIPTVLKVVGDYAWEQHQQRTDKPESPDAFLTKRHGGMVGLMETLERWVARRANKIVTPSRYLQTVVEKWGVPSDQIQVIYNSTEPLPPPADDSSSLRERYHLEGTHVLFWSGRAVPWKRWDFLFRVLARLSDEYCLVLAGDGPMFEMWKQMAASMQLTDRVIFLGRQTRAQVSAWYEAADAFVLPSSYEGFPHTVVEAVSTGLPCFVSDACGNPETRELFPEHVTVLPLLDETVWVQALQHLPSRKNRVDLAGSLEQMLRFYQQLFTRK